MEFYALVMDEGSLSALIDGELGELGRRRALNDHWLLISGVQRRPGGAPLCSSLFRFPEICCRFVPTERGKFTEAAVSHSTGDRGDLSSQRTAKRESHQAILLKTTRQVFFQCVPGHCGSQDPAFPLLRNVAFIWINVAADESCRVLTSLFL